MSDHTFVVTRRIYPEPWQADKLNTMMDILNRMYNKSAKHCMALFINSIRNRYEKSTHL